MRRLGIQGVTRSRPTTAMRRKIAQARRAPDLVWRDFSADGPNQLWVADITYVPVTQGFFYLVAVMDWATRHVLAWRLSNTMDASFCVEALDDALGWRAPEILNTDQGAQPRFKRSSQQYRVEGFSCAPDFAGH